MEPAIGNTGQFRSDSRDRLGTPQIQKNKQPLGTWDGGVEGSERRQTKVLIARFPC